MKGTEFAEIRDAITRAFTPYEFDTFLYEQLDFVRQRKVADGPFEVVVSNVLKTADMEGWAPILIAEAAVARPLRREVQEIYARYAEALVDEARQQKVAEQRMKAMERFGKYDALLPELTPGGSLLHPERLEAENPSSGAAPTPPASVLAQTGATVTGKPAAPASPVRLQLESYRTNFIERDAEKRALQGFLLDKPLVALTGVTGMGKTRLALEAAAEIEDRFRDGAFFVDLTEVTSPALAETVSSKLKLLSDPVEFLRSRNALLVLDTCDRHMESCRRFAKQLLASNEKLHILAICQQSLNISELTYAIPPLSRPNRYEIDRAIVDPAFAQGFAEYEAVKLFKDRAVDADQNFKLEGENLIHAGKICERLQGIPVLIEMAAKFKNVFHAEQLADRPERAVGASDEDWPSRQKTVSAMMDWVFQSLDGEMEPLLMRRLSVFAGGWTPGAAEFVAAGKPVRSEDVGLLMKQLVDKSMMVVDKASKPWRYWMLHTIRDYARAKLDETSEAESIRARHCDYFLKLAEETQPYHGGVQETAWLNQMETEHDNLRAAFEWCQRKRQNEKALRLAGAMFWFSNFRGYIREGRSWATRALALKPARSTPARARALYAAGALAWLDGDSETALANLKESIAMARSLVLKHGHEHQTEQHLAYALLVLGLQQTVPPKQAVKHVKEALAIFESRHDRWGVALAHHDQGNVLNRLHLSKAAHEQYAKSLRHFRAAGSKWGQALALNDLAAMEQSGGQHEEARRHLSRAADLYRELQDKPYLAAALIKLGYHYKTLDLPHAIRLFKESVQLAHEVRNDHMFEDSLFNLAQLAHDTGHPHIAVSLLAALQLDVKERPPTIDMGEFESRRNLLQEQLGTDAFDAAWAQGEALTRAQALMYVLRELSSEFAAPFTTAAEPRALRPPPGRHDA